MAAWFAGWQHEYEPVATDGAMAVAESAGEFFGAGWCRLAEGIDKDVVIATAMHTNPAEGRHW
ncbi:MAG UNVERIFIED_CONTAM: hypothetical protein LVR18_18435 [Planctomycetaceae bacterium]|jgi:hypothetical protein